MRNRRNNLIQVSVLLEGDSDLLGISFAAFGDHPASLGILLTSINTTQWYRNVHNQTPSTHRHIPYELIPYLHMRENLKIVIAGFTGNVLSKTCNAVEGTRRRWALLIRENGAIWELVINDKLRCSTVRRTQVKIWEGWWAPEKVWNDLGKIKSLSVSRVPTPHRSP
jgi:hypothetical protein